MSPSPAPPMLERKVTISSLSPADKERVALHDAKTASGVDGTDDHLATWTAVCNVIRAVASRVEEPSKLVVVEKGLVCVIACLASVLTLHLSVDSYNRE
jgi:hypothetical protein